MPTPPTPSTPDGPTALPYPDADTLADHWWWRPGWQIGTRFLAWHVTVADLPPLADHVAAYQTALRPFRFLDLIPRPWLHVTVQGIDHTSAVSDTQLGAVTAAVAEQLAAVPAPALTFDRPTLHREAVVIPPTDPQPLRAIRQAIRDGIEATYGPPEGAPMSSYRPHVSAAYVNAAADPAPVRAALDALDVPPAAVTITHLTLMEIHRDRRMYEWRTLTTTALGPP
jgi:2'-5' RNA ligase superfamily